MNKFLINWLVLGVYLSAPIMFYKLPSEVWVALFMLPAIVMILKSYNPYSRSQFIMFIVFGIVGLRYAAPSLAFGYSGNLLVRMLTTLYMFSFFLIIPNDLQEIYNRLYKIFFWVSFLGFILFIVKTISPGSIPHVVANYSTEGRYHNVYPLFCLNIHRGVESIRFMSIFSEPGFLGTAAALILAIERYDFRKWKNVVLAVMGFASFSLAFVMSTVLYVIFSSDIRSGYTARIGIVAAVIIVLSGMLFPAELDRYFWSRLEYNEEYGLMGDSRGGLPAIQSGIEDLSKLTVAQVLLGVGQNVHVIGGMENSYLAQPNFSRLVIQIGLLMFLFLGAATLFFGAKNGRYTLIFAFIFLINIYHRPNIFQPFIIVLFAYGISALKYAPIQSSSKTLVRNRIYEAIKT